ncbi:5-dehydro-4-deoxy-D-glucuronate isomerase [Actinomyces vulturis]|uniref:5-dehydro-4-deoxy-D-glucuronate isomerase n=1 Tax=Actinomyces vulturis TaxID=1857645 RepID=UPI0008354D07|nr:5-dehydro-4-deoxy-D-glucuronate isomerase [Actinomyces vulturis]
MQSLDIRHAHGPADIARFTTEELRQEFLVEKVFVPGEIKLTYTYHDRMIFGGVTPTDAPLEIVLDKELGVDYFLEIREMGVINIGGPGSIEIDGQREAMVKQDGFYIGKETRHVVFSSDDPANPARFYIASAPAHQKYPNVRINIADIKPIETGEGLTLNERKIYQYVHPNVCQSAQLQMGLTMLAPGSAWNTMPCHTHARRMEAYVYFDMDEEARVFHLMGEPDATKHLVMGNDDAVISPSWSIHSGVGTSNYSFIWAMCGENKAYTDMDVLPASALK